MSTLSSERDQARAEVKRWSDLLFAATNASDKEQVELCKELLKDARKTYDSLIAQSQPTQTAPAGI